MDLRQELEIFKNTHKIFSTRYLSVELIERINIATSFLEQNAKLLERCYCILHNITERQHCKVCGNDVKFAGSNEGYNIYCSYKCMSNSNEVKQKKINTCMQRYGVSAPAESQIVKEHARETFLKNYGVDHPFKSEIIKGKIKKTNLSRFGSENVSSNQRIHKKKCDTNLKNYGVEYFFKTDKFKELSKKTNLEKYGTEIAVQSDVIKQKLSNTFKDVNVIKRMKENIKKTSLQRYGKENPMQNQMVKSKCEASIYSKYGVYNVMHNVDIVKKLTTKNLTKSYQHFINSIKEYDCVPLFDIRTWIDKSGYSGTYHWVCKKCNSVFEAFPYYNGKARCLKCNPLYSNKTTAIETKMKTFLDENCINYNHHDRKVIKPQEIDFYIDEHKIGIECDGIYWHSDKYLSKDYHFKKYQTCVNQGIKLLQFYEDEILDDNKFAIVKSMILHRLLKSPNKFYARKCKIKNVEQNLAKHFLNENHLQGYRYAKYNFGLFYENELISILSVNQGRGKFIKGTTKSYEVVRFANKLLCSVCGGYSKLINYFIKTVSTELYMYIDLRYSDIEHYYNDWELDGKPTIGYYYRSGTKRLHRFNFTKSRLKKLCNKSQITIEESDTENTLATKLGIYKIYDAGQQKLKLK